MEFVYFTTKNKICIDVSVVENMAQTLLLLFDSDEIVDLWSVSVNENEESVVSIDLDTLFCVLRVFSAVINLLLHKNLTHDTPILLH